MRRVASARDGLLVELLAAVSIDFRGGDQRAQGVKSL
jgi:hypothetical protein